MGNPPNTKTSEQPTNGDDYRQFMNSLSAASQPPKKRKKFVIYAVVGAVLILTVVAAFVFIYNSSGKTACKDDKCFNQHFASCSPADYTYSQAGSSVQYTITGDKAVGCLVSAKYLEAKYSPEVVGKSMTCDFDSRLDFPIAAKNAFLYPADYDCKGDLANLLEGAK